MIREICEQKKCTGCFACMNVCPKDAIVCYEDTDGKYVPVIQHDKCIECKKCIKVCPVNHEVKKNEPLECYAAWSKNIQDSKGCASGGIATQLAKKIITDGGVVYGAAFDSDFNLEHIEVRYEKELERLKGSKYAQSYTGFQLREIKQNLDKGKKVLFIGTPCQVAGVKSYMGEQKENLILVDLICHGTPPIKYLKEYIKEVTNGENVTKVEFRGEKDFRFVLYADGKEIYSKRSMRDYYFAAFLKALTYRENCYQCSYAQSKRCSDITIGDFWGIKRRTLKQKTNGRISVVLVNTEQGMNLWKDMKETVVNEKRGLREAIKGNAQLRAPAECTLDRESFIQLYPEQGFLKALQSAGMKKILRESLIKDSFIYRGFKKIKKGMESE